MHAHPPDHARERPAPARGTAGSHLPDDEFRYAEMTQADVALDVAADR